MDKNQAIAAVQRVLSAVLGNAGVVGAAATREDTPKWDSLKHIELMFALEEAFDVEFTEEQFAEFDSVDSIADALVAADAA